jgi:hypothetical protein
MQNHRGWKILRHTTIEQRKKGQRYPILQGEIAAMRL